MIENDHGTKSINEINYSIRHLLSYSGWILFEIRYIIAQKMLNLCTICPHSKNKDEYHVSSTLMRFT